MRARQVSRPRTSSVSNSGGAVLRPHTATRIGLEHLAGLDAQFDAGGAQSGFQSVVRELGGGQDLARLVQDRSAIAASPFLGISSAVS